MAGDTRSELELFASFFHQDFDLEGDAYKVAREHFHGISPARRKALKTELATLLEFRKSKKALRNAWWRLGAGGWQRGLDLRTALREFADML